jgi:hypothetical protein
MLFCVDDTHAPPIVRITPGDDSIWLIFARVRDFWFIEDTLYFGMVEAPKLHAPASVNCVGYPLKPHTLTIRQVSRCPL